MPRGSSSPPITRRSCENCEHVRAGFAELDGGEIDEFDLDDLIHHYKRSAAELRKLCGSSGGQWQQAANVADRRPLTGC